MQREYKVIYGEKEVAIQITPLEDGSFQLNMGDFSHKFEKLYESASLFSFRIDGSQIMELDTFFHKEKCELQYKNTPYHLEVFDPRRSGLGSGAVAGKDGLLVAPMPGKVIELKVKEGDEVTADTPIIIIEAMKMQNELNAPISGIVKEISIQSGEVVVHCGQWNQKDPDVLAGKDPMFIPSFRIWGYETNWGSFAQFTKVQDHQCLPKPKHLTWEAAASYMLVGATAYRMLTRWGEHAIQADDVVLIWGGAGGLGSMAIQIAKAKGAKPIAVVGSDDKIEYCKKLGAVGVINRKNFDHWGMLPHWKDEEAYGKWLKGARAFGKAIWEILGEKKSPRIVFEHPGETTVPTSAMICDTGGMVVICAGTTGYNATIDLRYHWMRQKRFQGSHFANDVEAKGFNDLVIENKVDPCLSKVWQFNETGACHQLMWENKHPHGNMAILVNATKEGMTGIE